MTLLQVRDLAVRFKGCDQNAVSGVSFDVQEGEVLSIVGESGSGKSVAARSILRLNRGVEQCKGSVLFDNKDLLTISRDSLRQIRGKDISFVFQNSANILNPLHTVGKQIAEAIMLHQNVGYKQAMRMSGDLLRSVGVPDEDARLDSYPHEFSGGQQQRIVIAMALANKPKILIADEPITALDCLTKNSILALLLKLQREHNMAMIFITHDLSAAKFMGNRVLVMCKGSVCEYGSCNEVFESPQHEYTQKLIQEDISNLDRSYVQECGKDTKNVLSVCGLSYECSVGSGYFWSSKKLILDDISFSVPAGSTVGIIGESGSGKSTIAKAIMSLIKYKGSIVLGNGTVVSDGVMREHKGKCRTAQIIFQDPCSSMNPYMRIRDVLKEGLAAMRICSVRDDACEQRLIAAMADVGLSGDMLNKYPSNCSGGELQRIAIARALLLKPEVVVMDEPTSALDVINENRVVRLLIELQKKYNLSYVLISHDIRVVKAMSDFMLVVRKGKIVGQGLLRDVLQNTQDNYIKALLNADISV